MTTTLPPFKTKLISIGNSRGIVIPAKMLEDHKVKGSINYWARINLTEAEE